MKVKYEKCHRVSEQTTSLFPDVDDALIYFYKQVPSRHAIAAFFLFCFWEKEPLYTNKMGCLKTNSDQVWLSCDHTFSSVSNVGSVRPNDGKWVKQYNGLFCVLNPEGQVLTWKLTKSLCFEHIEEQLQLLNDRFSTRVLCGYMLLMAP